MKDTHEPINESRRRTLPDLLRALLSGSSGSSGGGGARAEEQQRREFDRNKDSLARFRKEVANRNKLGQKEDL